jgi:hypothetical protein
MLGRIAALASHERTALPSREVRAGRIASLAPYSEQRRPVLQTGLGGPACAADLARWADPDRLDVGELADAERA